MTPDQKEVTESFIEILKHFGFLGLVGLVAGIGALLASKETLTARVVIGRAISSFMLGMGAASALTWFPELSFNAQVGIACLTASIGTSGLERILQKIRG